MLASRNCLISFLLVTICHLFRLEVISARNVAAQVNHNHVNETMPSAVEPLVKILRKKRNTSKLARLQLDKWEYTKEEIKEIFDKYNECIEQSTKPGVREKEPIAAILAVEGERVSLKCTTCYRPDQTDQQARIFWQMIRNEDASVTLISSKTPGVEVEKDMTLVIKKVLWTLKCIPTARPFYWQVDVNNAGHYYCVKGDDAEAIYQLDVILQEPQKMVKQRQDLQPAQKLVEHNLEVFTQWSEWAECDVCGKAGSRKRKGACMVKKTDVLLPSKPVDVPIMVLYPDGVPCRSTVLPSQISQLPGIGDRRSEVLLAQCTVTCPLVPLQSENAELAYLPFVGLTPRPTEPPPDSLKVVERSVLYMDVGSHLILTCPTDKGNEVRWQRGQHPIRSNTVRRLTRGRVYIDIMKRFIIKRLMLKDTDAYSCWVATVHVATMKVIVDEPIDRNIKNYITYGGLVLTVFSLFTFLICKLFVGRPKRKK